MSWSITRPRVTFNVRPVKRWDARKRDPMTPKAGLATEVRKELRAKRDREQRKVI